MIKQFTIYWLVLTLTMVLCPFSFAAESLRDKANNHLNEAQHEFLEDNDTQEAAKELRSSAEILKEFKDQAKPSKSVVQKFNLGVSANKLETIASKMENGKKVNAKEFNEALKYAKDSLTSKK